MSAIIRPAQLGDLAALTELLNHYILHTHITFDVSPYRVEERLDWFHTHSGTGRYQMVVAEEAGLVIGYAASGRFRPKEAYDTTVEVSIAIAAEAGGKGLGTRLYQTLFAALAGQDIHRLVAAIAQPNDASNALHRKLGFQDTGTLSQVGRKFGRYWDVRFMERPLKP